MSDALRNDGGAVNLAKRVMFQNFSTPVGEVIESIRDMRGEFIFMSDPLVTSAPDVTPIESIDALKDHCQMNRGLWADGYVYDLRGDEVSLKSGSNTRLEILSR